MTLLTIDSRFTGLTSQPEGTVVVCRGQCTTGALWWKKTELVWLVKIVRGYIDFCGGFAEYDNFWTNVGVFRERADADRLAEELRSQG